MSFESKKPDLKNYLLSSYNWNPFKVVQPQSVLQREKPLSESDRRTGGITIRSA